jgi:hypothetical protein
MDKFTDKIFKLRRIVHLKVIIDNFLKCVKEGKYSIDDIVVAFDIDDTLITIDVSDDYHIMVAAAFNIKREYSRWSLSNLEYAVLHDKVPCEQETLGILDYINECKIASTIITSRRQHLNKATMLNLDNIGIMQRVIENGFYQHGVPIRVDKGSLYTNNVLLVSDQSKGHIFKNLLSKLGRKFKIIVIVDNTMNKIESFFEAFDAFDAFDSVKIIGLYYALIRAE